MPNNPQDGPAFYNGLPFYQDDQIIFGQGERPTCCCPELNISVSSKTSVCGDQLINTYASEPSPECGLSDASEFFWILRVPVICCVTSKPNLCGNQSPLFNTDCFKGTRSFLIPRFLLDGLPTFEINWKDLCDDARSIATDGGNWDLVEQGQRTVQDYWSCPAECLLTGDAFFALQACFLGQGQLPQEALACLDADGCSVTLERYISECMAQVYSAFDNFCGYGGCSVMCGPPYYTGTIPRKPIWPELTVCAYDPILKCCTCGTAPPPDEEEEFPCCDKCEEINKPTLDLTISVEVDFQGHCPEGLRCDEYGGQNRLIVFEATACDDNPPCPENKVGISFIDVQTSCVLTLGPTSFLDGLTFCVPPCDGYLAPNPNPCRSYGDTGPTGEDCDRAKPASHCAKFYYYGQGCAFIPDEGPFPTIRFWAIARTYAGCQKVISVEIDPFIFPRVT